MAEITIPLQKEKKNSEIQPSSISLVGFARILPFLLLKIQPIKNWNKRGGEKER